MSPSDSQEVTSSKKFQQVPEPDKVKKFRHRPPTGRNILWNFFRPPNNAKKFQPAGQPR